MAIQDINKCPCCQPPWEFKRNSPPGEHFTMGKADFVSDVIFTGQPDPAPPTLVWVQTNHPKGEQFFQDTISLLSADSTGDFVWGIEVGRINNNLVPGSAAMVSKHDRDGNRILFFLIGDPDFFNAGEAIFADNDGGIFVATREDTALERRVSVITRLDSDGNTLWERRGDRDISGNNFEAIAEFYYDGSSLYVVTSVIVEPGFFGDRRLAIIKLDGETGEEIWRESLNVASGIAVINDFVWSAQFLQIGPFLVDRWVSHRTTDGSQIQFYSFVINERDGVNIRSQFFSNLVVDSNDNIIVAVYSEFSVNSGARTGVYSLKMPSDPNVVFGSTSPPIVINWHLPAAAFGIDFSTESFRSNTFTFSATSNMLSIDSNDNIYVGYTKGPNGGVFARDNLPGLAKVSGDGELLANAILVKEGVPDPLAPSNSFRLGVLSSTVNPVHNDEVFLSFSNFSSTNRLF